MANAPGFSRSNPQYDMTIKQQIKHGAIQNCVICIIAFFALFSFARRCQFYSISSPPLFTKFH